MKRAILLPFLSHCASTVLRYLTIISAVMALWIASVGVQEVLR